MGGPSHRGGRGLTDWEEDRSDVEDDVRFGILGPVVEACEMTHKVGRER